MTDTEYNHYATLFSRGSNTGTEHLVVEKDGSEVKTACGLELHETGMRVGDARQVFVDELDEDTTVGGNTCGNCPWEEVLGDDAD